MAYARLGEYVFERLIGFNDFETSGRERYPEHALINLKPRLDHTGSELRVIKFSVHYHRSFCVIEDEVSQLWAAKGIAAILPLVLGNGRVIGDFVIEEIIENIKQTMDDGTYVDATVSITLKECVIQDKLSQAEKDAQLNATSVSSNNPNIIRGSIKQYQNLSDQMIVAADKAFAESKGIDVDIADANNNFESFLLKTQQITSRINSCVDYLNTAMDIVNNPDYVAGLMSLCNFVPWDDECAAMFVTMGLMKGSALDVLGLMPITGGSIGSIKTSNTTFQSRSADMRKSASVTQIQKGTRRI